MRVRYLIIGILATTTLLSGCKSFNDYFVFREEQKHLVAPKPPRSALNAPQRLAPPLPKGEHYTIN
jgi:hypothetical protein